MLDFTETHARTLAKAVLYRILSVVAIMLLTIAFGGTVATAGKVGLAVIVLGTTIYYIHERVWIRYGWARLEGLDKARRSLVKTVIYRVLTMIAMFIIVKFIVGSSNSTAVAFSIAQAVVNMALFYGMERVFNMISWGKVFITADASDK